MKKYDSAQKEKCLLFGEDDRLKKYECLFFSVHDTVLGPLLRCCELYLAFIVRAIVPKGHITI